MATYEVLEPGGHAQLVSDIKTYVNRADGVGTTQLADESVTMDKLGEDVIDELDDIMHDGDPLNGNALFGTLAENTVLTTDDAFAAPPKGVEVYGVSTQVTTTGKNLLNPTTVTLGKYFDVNGYLANTSNWDVSDYIEVSGTNICVSGNETANNVYHAFYDESKTFLSTVRIDTAQPFTIPSNAKYIRVTIHKTRTNTAQVELGTTATAYEPYSGGAASPRPDWPQPIESVDDLTLHVCGKNVCGTITDHPDGKRFYGYGVNSSNRYPKLSCDLPAGTYTLSMDVRSIDATPTYGQIRVWARDANDGLVYNFNVSTDGAKTEQGAGGARLFSSSGSYSTPVPITYTHASCVIHIGFPVSELIFGLYNSGEYIEYQNLQLEHGDTATAYTPYVGQSIPISLSNHIARSLPDGTRDTLTLSYIGPSETAGYGVFGAELVQKLNEDTFDGTESWSKYTSTAFYLTLSDARTMTTGSIETLCNKYQRGQTIPMGDSSSAAANTIFGRAGQKDIVIKTATEYSTVTDFKSALTSNPITVVYALATPQTIDLGTVELPVNPAPDLTAWADGGSAQPTLSMKYERDVNIVIAQLEAQIAELLTS